MPFNEGQISECRMKQMLRSLQFTLHSIDSGLEIFHRKHMHDVELSYTMEQASKLCGYLLV
jgi:hypothetical protein